MVGVVSEPISTQIERYGFYEPGLSRFLIEHLSVGAFIDVGAHFGYFSLLAASLLGDRGQVHSFEPVPSTSQVLEMNCSGVSNIALNGLAVSNAVGRVSITDLGIAFSAYNTLGTPRTDRPVDSPRLTVASTTLDDYVLDQRLNPAMIKIDAENWDLAIVQGAVETLRAHRPIVVLEAWDESIAEGTVALFHEIRRELRYELMKLDLRGVLSEITEGDSPDSLVLQPR